MMRLWIFSEDWDMTFIFAFFLAFTLTVCAGNTDPLWSLKEVAELSELLQQAQGRDRFGFLELLDDADGEDDPSSSSSSSSSSSTEASSSSDSSTEAAASTTSARPNKTLNSRRGRPGNIRQGGGGSGRRGGMSPGFEPLADGDDTKWFNAQAFVKWFVRGLANLYEGLVNLMLLPLKILISFIDV